VVKSEREGVPAGELARALGVPQNTLSAHLAILARAGLVVGERQSRSIIYRAKSGDLPGVDSVHGPGLLRRQRSTVRPAA